MNSINKTNYKKKPNKKKVNFQGVPNNISAKNKLLYLQNKLIEASNNLLASNKLTSSTKSSSSSPKSPNKKISPLKNLTSSSSSSASSPRAFKNVAIRSPPMKPKKSKV